MDDSEKVSFAIGVICGKYDLTVPEAHNRFIQTTMHLNIKKQELADKIIHEQNIKNLIEF